MSNSVSIKKATMINFIARYSNILMQLIINGILARILTPDDYGVVAVITVFISFFTILADMGIGPAIVQNKDLDKYYLSNIFIFTMIVGGVASFAFMLFSYPLSIFYNENVYISLGKILSLSILFNILNIVPKSILSKNKEFKSIGVITVVVTILCGIITTALALYGFKYYALAINSVLVALFTFILTMLKSKFRIYPKFNMSSINKVREFSTYQFAFNTINYFSRNLDNLLIGKLLGEVYLGYYDKAYKLMLYPVQNLTHVITPVLHPILSEYQNDRETIYNQYIKIVKLLSLIGIFFSVFCYFSAGEIINIMFGDQWSRSIGSFKILSISIVIQMVLSSTGTIFQSTNETKKLFIAGMLGAISNVTGIIIGIIAGKIEYISLGILIAYFINFFSGFYLLIKYVFKRNFIQFLSLFNSTIIIGLICSIVMMVFNYEINNILISCIYKLIICVLGYLVGLIITKEYKFIKSIIVKK